ncbi:MAG: putrescine/ornithine APC transporter [Candidatus Hepatoplasma vulgare]|nr:MAG: putrescine/ornithine APC transporter [Candidatus Hepatoplasma sp.]
MNVESKKTIIDNQKNAHRYGLLSMLALIIGIVIGSGIYVVNDQLYKDSNGSTGISMIAWIVVSLIVLFMLISFIEVSSITSKKHEAGTVNNWSRHLWGENISKYVGIFFPIIYYPVLLTGFSLIMSTELMSNVNSFDSLDSKNETWMYFIYVSIIAFIVLNLIFGLNTFTSKPGKNLQEIGTFIKLIPLFLIVIVGFIAIVGLMNAPPANDVFDTTQTTGDDNVFKLILILSPTVMFSYDGFLFAASLQNEAKKKSTFKTAAITGVVFIILIYILMSFFTFAYGDPTTGDYSVNGAFHNLFPNVGNWFFTLISVIIVISVITGISGNTITQGRMIADVSVENQIADKNGNLIARNKAFVPQKSVQIGWILSIITFVIFTFLDAFSTMAYLKDYSPDIIYSPNAVMSNALNDLVLIAFAFYAFIIVGGLFNRWTGRVEVDKNKLFIPSAIISSIAIVVILIVFAIDIFSPNDLNNHAYNLYNYILQIVIFVTVIALIISVPLYLQKDVKKLTKEEKKNKRKLIIAYNRQKIDPRYKNKK